MPSTPNTDECRVDDGGDTIPICRPAITGATSYQIWRSRLALFWGRLASRLGVGGHIKPIVIDDAVTGQHVEIRVGPFLTMLSVDGRDYFFRRWTGEFDGTGMALCGRRRLPGGA